MAGIKLSDSSQSNLLDTSNSQWFERRGKVVMLLVDALRFDYLLNGQDTVSNKRFPDNKFKKLNNFIAENPENFVVMRARADAPTMTVNRIPCIATGNIPPKAALLQALEALPAVEDSFPRQLRLLNRKSFFTGDPLWVEYFPDDFTESCPALGFNIKDPAVDSNTIPFLKKKIAENNFDLLLGHVLSIDHMGHSFGLGDERVKTQIAANDKLILDIIDSIDQDTTLVILGDHGMDALGTHGGNTDDETETAILAFHKKGFQKYHQKGLSQVMRSVNETDLFVKQQDIAPTLSMLMGIPIPFSNMGQMINDIYPALDYPGPKECPNAGFEAQILRDNYLNSLQILNYVEKFQHDAHLFNKKNLDRINSLAKEVHQAYSTAEDMIKSSQQCEASFHDLVVETVLKTQNLSEEVYNITRNAGAFDMPLIHEGLALLILVMISYILIMQYLYRKGHNEKSLTWRVSKLIGKVKKVGPVLIMTTLATVATWYYKKNALHCLTTVILCSAVSFCGGLAVSLFKKEGEEVFHKGPMEIKVCRAEVGPLSQQQKSSTAESQNIESLDVTKDAENISRDRQTTRDDEYLFEIQREGQPVLEKGLLFVFQTPVYSAVTVALIVYCIICVHASEFQGYFRDYIKPASPFVVILAAGYRVYKLFPHKFNPAMPLTVIACAILVFNGIEFSSERLKMGLGLLLLLEYVCSEISYITKKLGTSKLWGIAYLVCFSLLIPYNLIKDKEDYLVEIAIPRVFWGLLIGIVILRVAFRIEKHVIIRNLQLCFVLYLALLQRRRVLLYFAVLLITYKIINRLYKQADVLNYTYPIVLAFMSMFGLHWLGHDDRNIPMRFDRGFVGLHDFHFLLSPLMVFLNIMSGHILSMISLSHYNKSIDEDGMKRDNKVYQSKEHAQVLKKRNIFPFLLLFSVIYLGGVMKTYMWRYYFLTEAQEKFMIDAVLYILSMIGGLCLF